MMVMLGEPLLQLGTVTTPKECTVGHSFHTAKLLAFILIFVVAVLYFGTQPHHLSNHVIAKSRKRSAVWLFLHAGLGYALLCFSAALEGGLGAVGDIETHDGDEEGSGEDEEEQWPWMLCIALAAINVQLLAMRVLHYDGQTTGCQKLLTVMTVRLPLCLLPLTLLLGRRPAIQWGEEGICRSDQTSNAGGLLALIGVLMSFQVTSEE